MPDSASLQDKMTELVYNSFGIALAQHMDMYQPSPLFWFGSLGSLGKKSLCLKSLLVRKGTLSVQTSEIKEKSVM